MPSLSQCCGVMLLTVVCFCSQQTGYAQKERAAVAPGKPTHILQPALLEVAPTRADGNPWDTGIGAFARPDPQVTLMRHDAKALQAATELLIQMNERRLQDLGKPVPPKFREVFARNAMVSLRCGATIAASQDQQLIEARSKFAADTAVASDSLLTKLVDGGLQVAVGDKVSLFVNDVDLAAHDLLGQLELEVTQELLAKDEVELKFNSVESLRLKITPTAR